MTDDELRALDRLVKSAYLSGETAAADVTQLPCVHASPRDVTLPDGRPAELCQDCNMLLISVWP